MLDTKSFDLSKVYWHCCLFKFVINCMLMAISKTQCSKTETLTKADCDDVCHITTASCSGT